MHNTCYSLQPISMEGKSTGSSSDSKVAGLGGQNLAKPYQRWLQFEVVVLCFVMVIVWGLLMLPIVFFYHPIPVVSNKLVQSFTVNKGGESTQLAKYGCSITNST